MAVTTSLRVLPKGSNPEEAIETTSVHTETKNPAKPLHLGTGGISSTGKVCTGPNCLFCGQNADEQREEDQQQPFVYNGVTYYTWDEISKHSTPDSVWVVAGDDVYDVTSYLSQHPGGVNSLLKRAGGVRDCTEDFLFHGAKGRKAWKRFHIGKVKRCNNVGVGEKQWWNFWS
eukprot:Nitzschia sp. Nitz4//scaffold51_size120721//111749//112267//NITZ4_003748-RA/size120721-processed-gene-0.166-mRNA-1//-1//CDS//3329553925//4293//frame0